MKSKTRFFQILSLAALAQPMIAEAHPFHWSIESIGFFSGLIHPITGADHILMMLMVGLWISQASKRLIYLMPLIFVTLMLIGGLLTLIPIEIMYAEQVMYLFASLLALMMATGFRVSSLMAKLIVGVLTLFHGYTHAYDIWLDINAVGYTVGFTLTTMMLMIAGIAVRSVINWRINKNVSRFFPDF